jgi:hypothetical protein
LDLSVDQQQKEIVRVSDELSKIHGRSWFTYKGDVVARAVISLLKSHVVASSSVVGPGVYVEDCPTEFDALVVEKGATPVPGTAAYRKDDVKVLIEIKKHGFYFKKIRGEYEIGKYFQAFRDAAKPFLYLTVRESSTFISATQKILGENSFFLGVSHGELREGEWNRFVERVRGLL